MFGDLKTDIYLYIFEDHVAIFLDLMKPRLGYQSQRMMMTFKVKS
jgi:hypothetical protein